MSKSNETTPNVPTLRFKKYDTNWDRKKLSDYVKKITRKNSNNVIKNVICNSAQNGLIPQLDFFDKEIANNENTAGYYIISNGDFVYNPRKSLSAPYGPVNIYKYDSDGIVSPLYLCFSVDDCINKSFLLQRFKSPCWYRYIYLNGDSGARHDRVSIKDEVFLSQPINLPNAEEQAVIAEFLEKIDERISVQNKIISDLKVLKKELCRKMLSSITEYKTLCELCSITTGKLDANANTPDGLYPFFTCGKDTLSIDNYAFDGEAILIAGNGDIGHTKYYCGKFNAYQRTYVLMNFKADAQFIKMGIDTYLPQKISEETQGGAMPYIKLSTLTLLKIPFATEEKQLSIRNHYNAIVKKVENEMKILDLLLQQKSYFLNAMFI